MVTLTYGETSIPADSYSVTSGGTVQVAAAFERSVGIVGGMDSANGTAAEGEAVEFSTLGEAAELFGENSEIYKQADLARLSGAATLYATPVETTTDTQSFTATTSGSVDNAPVMNPQLHPSVSLTITDTVEGVDVDVTYVYGTPTGPSDANTAEFNPITGEFAADESSDYDVEYTYGDYSAAITEMTTKEPRMLAVCSEAESVVNDGSSELVSDADSYVFQHGVYGAKPFADPSNPDVAGFTNPFNEERASIVASPYGYIDDAETEMVRTVGAVAGEMASLPLGVSATANGIGGLTGLRTDLSPNQAGDLIDEGVLPLIDYPGVEIVKDMTTSDDARFERVYTMNIADEIVTLLHEINREYIGDQARERTIRNLTRSVKNMLSGLEETEPPLLDTLSETSYAVEVERSASDDNVFNESVGVKPAGVIDAINVDVTLGDVVDITRR